MAIKQTVSANKGFEAFQQSIVHHLESYGFTENLDFRLFNSPYGNIMVGEEIQYYAIRLGYHAVSPDNLETRAIDLFQREEHTTLDSMTYKVNKTEIGWAKQTEIEPEELHSLFTGYQQFCCKGLPPFMDRRPPWSDAILAGFDAEDFVVHQRKQGRSNHHKELIFDECVEYKGKYYDTYAGNGDHDDHHDLYYVEMCGHHPSRVVVNPPMYTVLDGRTKRKLGRFENQNTAVNYIQTLYAKRRRKKEDVVPVDRT